MLRVRQIHILFEEKYWDKENHKEEKNRRDDGQ